MSGSPSESPERTDSGDPAGPINRNATGVVRRPSILSLASGTETMIKLVGSLAVLVTVLGVPAVFMQFRRFNVPAYLFSLDTALVAGLLPAFILALLSLFIFAFISLREGDRQRNSESASRLLTWIEPLMTAMLYGLVVVIFLGILFFLVSIVRFSFNKDYTADDFIQFGVYFGVVVVLYVIIFGLLKIFSNRLPWWKISYNKERLVKLIREKFVDSTPDSIKMLIICFFLSGYLYFIKGGLYFWQENLSDLISHEFIVIFAVVFWAIAHAAMHFNLARERIFSEQLSMEYDDYELPNGPSPMVHVGRALIPLYIVALILYAGWGYPRLPRSLGGGLTSNVSVWVDRTAISPQMELGSRIDSDAGSDPLIRLGDIRLIVARSDFWVFVADDTAESGIILPKSSIRAIEW